MKYTAAERYRRRQADKAKKVKAKPNRPEAFKRPDRAERRRRALVRLLKKTI